MENKTKHAALSNGKVYTITNGKWDRYTADPTTLDDLLTLADEHHYTHLWVLPDAGIDPTDAWANEIDASQWNVFTNTDGDVFDAHISSVTGYRVSTKYMPRLSVIFPKYTHWDWANVGVQELLIAIRYLEQELGIEVSGSPGMTGVRGIKASMEVKHPQAIAPVPLDLRAMGFTNDVISDIYWSRRPTDNEQEKLYFHKVDKNSAYLRGCQETYHGIGMPELMDGSAFDGKRPGLWDITIGRATQMYAPELMDYFPGILDESQDITRVPTPIVKLLRRTNEITINSGLAWTQSYRTLKSWAGDLWVSRQKMKHPHPSYPHTAGRELAYGGIKQIAVQTVGLIGSEKIAFNPDRPKMENRPDQRINVISENRSQMFYNMFKVFEQTTLIPVMVYNDALYYLSNEWDASVLFGNMLAPDKLGGLKIEWVVPNNDILRQLLATPRDEMSEAEKLHIINAYAKNIQEIERNTHASA